MIKRLADNLTKFICSHVGMPPEMVEVYRYGFEITISSLLNIILVLCCGLIIGDILASVVYLFVFILLRIFTGGYHATSYLRCNIVMILSFLLTYALYRTLIWLNTDIRILEAIMLANGLPIIIFSPVKNVHKELTTKKAKKFRAISITIYICLSALALAAILFEIQYGTSIIVTLTAVSVMILIEIIIHKKIVAKSLAAIALS